MNKQPGFLTRVITEWSRRCPGKTAIKSEVPPGFVSYLELEQNSNRIANFLHGKIVDAPPVVILLDRSPGLIASIIAVLKCGLVFVPVDPVLPAGRVKKMLEESRARWVITISKYYEIFKDILQDHGNENGTGGSVLKILLLDTGDAGIEPGRHCFYLEEGIERDKLTFDEVYAKNCYIYFTSGSSGVPKAVLGRQSGLVHFIRWELKEFQVDENFKISQFTPPSFDPFLRDIFLPLMAGGTCCIPAYDTLMNMRRLIRWVDDNQITLIHTVPSLFKQLVSEIEDGNCFHDLKYILLAGELLRGRDISSFIRLFKQRIGLVNVYGPTETTLAKLFYRIQPGDENRAVVPVGKPIDGARVLILDSLKEKCAVGKKGEIYIRTPFRSAGYYNDPGLTTRVFLKNPYGNHDNDLVYKTGDLGRQLADGNIELSGRVDFQVKIRGVRIEVGEIENRLLAHPGIKDTVVTAPEDENDEKNLCAYVTAAPGQNPSAADLKKYLSNELPDYMIPVYFVQLERFPLTANGKIDRQALPAPVFDIGADYVAPRDEIEKKLVTIWSDVLRVDEEKIGIRSNFFQLGGHSLRAALLTSRIHKEFQTNIPLREVFNAITIRALSRYIREAKKEEFLTLEPVEKKWFYPLSSVQERLYFLQLMEETNTGYNMPRMIILEGTIQKEKIEEILRRLIRRHESLRTCFFMVGDKPGQRVQDEVDFAIEYYSASAGIGKIIKHFVCPFDLSQAPLIRSGLIRQSGDRHTWMIDMHHIIADGTSLGVLVKDFILLYQGKELPPLKLHYRDYSQWEKCSREIIKEQETFWLEEFAGEIPVLDLPLDYVRPKVQSFEGNSLRFELDSHDVRALKELALKQGTSLYMELQTIYNILLWKLSNQEELVVGTPTAGRRHADLEQVIGMFVNTLALKNYPCGEKSVLQFLAEVKEKTLEAFANQDYQYDELVEKVMDYREASRNPLFDTMFVLQNLDIPTIETPGLKLEPCPYERNTAKFDLTLVCFEYGDQLPCLFEYSTRLFKQETIERFILYFKNIISAVKVNPGIRLADIDILSREEKRQLLIDFNDTAEEFPTHLTIYRLFEDQVDKNPDHAALVFKDITLTYRHFDERVNQLAHYLGFEKGVRVGDRAAVLLDRGLEVNISLLGVMKAGAAYVPLDPAWPGQRLGMVFNDASIVAAISQEKYREKLLPLRSQCPGFRSLVCMDDMDAERSEINRQPFTGPGVPGSANPAYVMYTSGSSGVPKGVVVEHRTIVNTLIWRKNFYNFHPGDVSLQNPPYFFDSSVTDIFTPLLGGARLVLISEEERLNSRVLGKIIKINRVSHLIFIPAFYNVLLEEIPHDLSGIRMITAAGEYFPDGLIKKHFEKLPHVRIFNEYGPTENSVNTTAYELKPDSLKALIGEPISNVGVYVLDRYLWICPIGVSGEMCLAGASLARGYLNNPEITADKFLTRCNRSYRSYKSYISNRLYKTGDMGKWQPDGNLEFLGRVDTQVKIRGIRVETGEIENHLLRHGNIKEAAVLAIDGAGAEKYLCAYVVFSGISAREDENNVITALKVYLEERLPPYMIPLYFVPIDKIPLTTSGKIDRKALPIPVTGEGDHFAPPRDEIENTLVDIWGMVLGKTKRSIGIDDNFFAAGGDSIKAIQIVSRLNSAGYKTDMKTLFQYPSIRELAPRLTKMEALVDQSPVTGRVPLSPIQEWYFSTNPIYPHHYNQAVMFYSKERIAPNAIKAVFTRIQEHHDALRMTYKKEIDTGEMRRIQTNHGPDYPLSLQEFDLREREHEDAPGELAAEANRIQAGIDLENGPLLKLGLFHLDDGDRLLIVIHHLVIDGISWRILFEDMDRLMDQYKNKAVLELPLKTDSFKTWAEKLRQYAGSEELLQEKSHWQELAEVSIPVLEKDFVGGDSGDTFVKDTAHVSFQLETGETGQLLTRVNQAFGTEINDILLTALGLALNKTWGHNRVLISLEGHGRENLFEEINISRTIGWFTSEYPVLLDVSFAGDPGRQIKEIKEMLRKIPGKGIGYGILKYLRPGDSKKEKAFELKPRLSFNYLGQLDADLKQTCFEFAGEPVGQLRDQNEKRVYELDINGLISQGRLTVSIAYSQKQYKAKTIAALSNHFKFELLRVIAYCASKDRREFTPSDFTCPHLCKSIEGLERLNRQYPGTISDIYPLTPMQQGMLFHTVYDNASGTYFEQTSYRLQGVLDVKMVKKSLDELFKRHDILRTAIVYQGVETPFQVVLQDREADVYYEDLRGITGGSETKEQLIEEFKIKDKLRGFDPGKDILMRVSILQVHHREYEVIWSFHHILMDGWCIGILNKEFFEIYSSRLAGGEPQLPSVTPYRTYIQWLGKQNRDASLAYWQGYLDSYEETVPVPGMKAQKDTVEYKKEKLYLEFDREKTLMLDTAAGKNHITLNTFIQAIWAILLGKYNDKEDVVFGSVVSGRPGELEGVEAMVGLFINTIPVRVRFSGQTRFKQLLQLVQADALGSEPYHYHPLAEIQSQSLLKKDLINHIFIFENYPTVEQIKGYENKNNSRVPFQILDVEVSEQTNYNFNLFAAAGAQLVVQFNFNGNVFDSELIGRIANHFQLLVEQVLDNEEMAIEELTLLSTREKQEILYRFNDTQAWYPKDKTIQQLFARQVEATPDRIALKGLINPTSLEGTRGLAPLSAPIYVTYKELYQKTDQLAGLLIEKGVKPGTIVGIMVERSIEMVIGLLGILQAGGAYLPIEPDYPEDRVNYIMSDSAAKIMLTAPDLSEKLEKMSNINCQLLMVNEKSTARRRLNNPPKESNSINNYQLTINNLQLNGNSLAYVIYTSGSTGRPKGVMVEQRSVVNLLSALDKSYPLTAHDSYLLKTSYQFDVSVTELFGWFWQGGRLAVLEPGGEKDPAKILEIIQKEKVTHINFVPSMFKAFAAALETGNVGKLSGLKYIFLAGEALLPGTVEQFRRLNTVVLLENLYGPTEASVYASWYSLAHWNEGSVPIGKPLSNVTLYILDKWGYLQPVGVPGELGIGGEGLARGYLNKPGLTSEKFLFIFYRSYRSYRSYISKRIYRTGDLARWLEDGNIEFLGRMDFQVKIRGFRIELGEIENCLKTRPGINDAIVIDRNDNERQYLCAYVTAAPTPGKDIPSTHELKEYLEGKLPGYMIPACFVAIEQIPLNPSGKVDRNQLPRALEADFHSPGTYEAPVSSIQKIIAETWQEVLGREKVGIRDNFFDLGGNSLDFIKISNKLKEKLGLDIPVVTLFTYPTICSLELYLTREQGVEEDDPGLIDEGKDLMRLTLKKLDSGD
jgi:amino acid adenylation domain-containing protein/non-ribosomal peptide synthase protein (TIGR01720 family)